MIPLAQVIHRFEADVLARYADKLLPSQRRALAAMKRCRNTASPRMQVQCQGCERRHLMPHSCGHRACPHCQHHESEQWLARQLKRQVPAEYFLITFTLPREFRAIAWRHQRRLYDALIKSSWQTLKTFAQNDSELKGTPGAIAVLHTHSRRLDYHPHVHVLMPAAAIDRDKRLWRTKRSAQGKAAYLFSHKALAKVFRAKMLAAITQAGLALPQHHPATWVVDCKAVGQGVKALVYLGRYLYRGVIGEKDILACNNGQVTFRYRESKTGQIKTRTLAGADFLWLLLRHVLPRRLRRTRNFGFLHPNSKRLIALVHRLLKVNLAGAARWSKKRPTLTCSGCGGQMKIIRTRIAPPGRLNSPPLGATGCTLM